MIYSITLKDGMISVRKKSESLVIMNSPHWSVCVEENSQCEDEALSHPELEFYSREEPIF
jgi:hypothetical protein